MKQLISKKPYRPIVAVFKLKRDPKQTMTYKFKSMKHFINNDSVKYYKTMETGNYCAWKFFRIYQVEKEFELK